MASLDVKIMLDKAENAAISNAKNFSAIITTRQKELGLSTNAIAEYTGLSYDLIQAIKDNKRQPNFEEFSRICTAIEVMPVINFWRNSELNTKDNPNTQVQIKLSDNATMPKKAYNGDAAYDLYASEDYVIPATKDISDGISCILASTGVSIAFPSYLLAQVWPRSGSSVMHSVETGAGMIDSNYRGEIKVKLYNYGSRDFEIKRGDRIAQLCFIHKANVAFNSCEILPSSDRDDKGFGSSGK